MTTSVPLRDLNGEVVATLDVTVPLPHIITWNGRFFTVPAGDPGLFRETTPFVAS